MKASVSDLSGWKKESLNFTIGQLRLSILRHRKKKAGRKMNRASETYGTFEYINIHIIKIPKGEKTTKGIEIIFKEIMAKTFQIWGKTFIYTSKKLWVEETLRDST